jgi:hypothetical protein
VSDPYYQARTALRFPSNAMSSSAAQLIFLLTSGFILNMLGGLLGFPFIATPLISSFIYVSSRVNPMETVPFKFNIPIQSWMLPYGLMAVDCLQAQSAAAAVPHVLGIFAGHFYHFFANVYPLMGGRAFLQAPGWLRRRVEGSAIDPMREPPAGSASTGKKVGGQGRNLGVDLDEDN